MGRPTAFMMRSGMVPLLTGHSDTTVTLKPQYTRLQPGPAVHTLLHSIVVCSVDLQLRQPRAPPCHSPATRVRLGTRWADSCATICAPSTAA